MIVENPSGIQIIPKMHEFLDCFFAIFSILMGSKDKDK
jgi:hypothetical protein